jgi:hypothetical protein
MMRPMRRTALTATVLALTGLLVGGCGGSGPRAISKAEAVAYARAVNLQGGDVPETPGSLGRASPEVALASLELLGCRHRTSPVTTVTSTNLGGLDSENGSTLIQSRVEVMPTAAAAARDYTNCLHSAYAPGSKQADLSALTTSSLGLPRSFAVRQTMTFPASLHQAHLYTDVLGFVYGPAEVSLIATGIRRPVPSALEQRLLSLLYSRAKAHKL